MIYSVPQIISLAKISEFLAVIDIAKGGLYSGGIDRQLPRKLYLVRKNVEWLYDLDPSNTTLTATTTYLYSLCNLKALSIISGGGLIPGQTITPSGTYLIQITGADFANATDYNDSRLVGKNLVIFWDGVNKYINSPSEWVSTSTGFRMTIAGFDSATDPTTHFEIFILN